MLGTILIVVLILLLLGALPHMASQPGMRLQPEWWAWLGPFDSDHHDTVGQVLGVRMVGCRTLDTGFESSMSSMNLKYAKPDSR